MSSLEKTFFVWIVALSFMVCTTACSRSTLESAQAQQITKIQNDLQQILSKLDTQSGLDYREKLKVLQASLSNRNTDVSAATQEVSDIQDSLSAFDAIELAEPIAAIEWTLRMNTLMKALPTAESLNEAELLLDQAPVSLGQSVIEDYSKRHAQQVVAFGQSLSKSNSSDLDELELVLEMLNRLNTTGESPTELEELKIMLSGKSQELRDAALLDALKDDVAALESQAQTALSLADADLRHAILTATSQSIDSLRMQLVLQGHRNLLAATDAAKAKVSEQVEKSFDAIAEKQKTAEKKARMKYQAWTLSEINKLNSLLDSEAISKELYRLRDDAPTSKEPVVIPWLDFQGVRGLFEKSIGKIDNNFRLTTEQQAKVGAFVKEKWYPIEYQVKHDSAVRHLLHIDQGMLDPPVAKFYSEAFERVWTQIEDGPGLQLSLACMTAEIPKRGLDDFMKE